MRRYQLAGAATVALGAAMIANALLGPLGLGFIRLHESASMETQLLGGELTTLVLAGPIAIVAGLLWWRGSPHAPALALGPLGYAIYSYVQFVLVPDYSRYPGNNEQWFPLYLLMVMTSWIMGAEAWRELRARPPIPPTHGTSTWLGGMLFGTNLLFALLWWGSIAAIYVSGPTPEYGEHPTAFWLVRLMDLGFVIPIGLATGLGLLRRALWAARMAYAFTGMQMLLTCAVAGMAVRMWLAGDPGANGAFAAILTIVAGGFIYLYTRLMMRASAIERRISRTARYAVGVMR